MVRGSAAGGLGVVCIRSVLTAGAHVAMIVAPDRVVKTDSVGDCVGVCVFVCRF